MKTEAGLPNSADYEQPVERVGYDFGLNRRSFVQMLSAGLLIAVSAPPALAQRRGGREGGGRAITLGARIHLGKDGSITVLTGKVEAGQGARAELTQAAAEELRVPCGRIQLVMSDTSVVPDDGMTVGSGSTPRTVPAVRLGAAAARELLLDFAASKWAVERSGLEMREGAAFHGPTRRSFGYADLANSEDAAKAFGQLIPAEAPLTPLKEWKALGSAAPRPNGREIVTGVHQYPSDIARPGMLYGKVLRPPSYGAKLLSVDLAPAKAMKNISAMQDGEFVGVAAPTTSQAEQALAAIAETAKWERPAHPSSQELFSHLRQHARDGMPENPFPDELAQAKQNLRQTYEVPYVAHAPLETRAAVAEWVDGRLTVWTSTQNPFGCRSELTRAFHLPEESVRVIVPDFGAGFGGKHSGEAGVEAARLTQGAGQPVSLHWTREEEFTWAYFRPAALIEAQATLDGQGAISSWHFINVNAGRAGIDTPYRVAKSRCQDVASAPPLRQGSYRALAATANHFARESFMDELAASAGADPLDFRLAHLENSRLRAVLETAVQRFGWKKRQGLHAQAASPSPTTGIGLACGTEKGSYVAACAEVEVDRQQNKIRVQRVCQVFECGAIMNPGNLHKQVQGAVIMGLGPALREEMRFEKGEMLNASFRKYAVPRFADVPELDVHLLDRPDLASAGAGETPIVVIAPAIANAVCDATGVRLRSLPLRLGEG